MSLPPPEREIRLVALRSLAGANFWSPGPITRLDIATGAYDEISSAEVGGVTEALLAALPGLVDHRCSVGERGGFVTRLKRGTYVPHIVEHVALELQTVIGHEVGFGRSRGGDTTDLDTVVFEHRHGRVGLRAGELALDIVRQAFGGGMTSIQSALEELAAIAVEPDDARPRAAVACGVTGGPARVAFVRELERRLDEAGANAPSNTAIVELPPCAMLETGIPYARSEIGVVVDAETEGLPERYREPELIAQLLAVIGDPVGRQGWVVLPAGQRALRDTILDSGRRVALFGSEVDIDAANGSAGPTAFPREGRVVIRDDGVEHEAHPSGGSPIWIQTAAALSALLLSAGNSSEHKGPNEQSTAHH